MKRYITPLKKQALSAILAVILVSAFATIQATAQTPQQPWIIAYAEILRDVSRIDNVIGFLLHDIDGDGIPELIIDGSGDGYTTRVYTFRDGRAIALENSDLVAVFYPAGTSRTRLVSSANGIDGIFRNDYPSGRNYHSHIVIEGYSLFSIFTWGASWDTADMDVMETFTSQIGTSLEDRTEISRTEFNEFQAMLGNELSMQRVMFGANFVQILSALNNTPMPSNAISVTIDGQHVIFADQLPAIVDGRTLVPVRDVFETLGFGVSWNEQARQVTLTRGNNTIFITIDSTTFTTNGTSHTLDVPAQIVGGRTMLPIRALLESVGYDLGWEEATRTVIITTI